MSSKLVDLGEIAEFINGYAFKPTDWSNTGIKIIRIQNLTSGEKSFNRTSKSVPDKYLVKKGDILVSWSATLDVFEWSEEEDALLNQHIFLVKPFHDRISKKYFKYALGYSIAEMSNFTHGSTMKHIVRKDFLKHKIPLPTIEEQNRIVKILDQAQSLIEKRKQAIAYLDDYIKAVFLDMFGDPVSNPKGWEVRKLEHLLKFLTSGSRGWAKYYSTNGEYFLSIKNVGRDNRLNLTNVVYINPPKNAEAKRTIVQKGDVLFSITADLGRTIVVPQLEKKAFINQHLAILRLKEQVDPIYMTHYLSSAGGQQQLKNLNKGSAKAGLNFNNIKSLNILLPPVQLQIKFASTVIKVELLREKMQSQLKDLENNFQAQLQRAFRGE